VDDHAKFIEELYNVTVLDLRRILNKFFKLFMDPISRVTVLTITAGDDNETTRETFQSISLPEHQRIAFDVAPLERFVY
jgi:hypothetical protein